jgi:stress-induced-phosphoprotein 1
VTPLVAPLRLPDQSVQAPLNVRFGSRSPPARVGSQAQAQVEKELGNAAYKKKSFDEAIAHYNKAQELDGNDISFMTNRAAVYLEMGQYAECIADCDAAVEKGRELRTDYKMVARAMARKGTALEKSGDEEAAISMYNKALTEHRSADVLTKLRTCEANLKKKTEEAYFDLDKATEEKDKGNEHFKGQRVR